MRLGLGIDTGGTYTDSVIYDFDTDKVLARAKDLTTKHHLLTGINASLGKLPKHFMREISLAALSTTLATNACVEGKGSRGKLVLMGYDDGILKRLGNKYGLPSCDEMILVSGSHGQQGQVLEEPDWEQLKQQILSCESDVDAFGVVEYWGVRNPAFEQKAKAIIRECTGLPVVSAHELSGEINSLRRASTTILNARLIPLIQELLEAVKQSLGEMGIEAPLMIVRGDGTLMSEKFARERPVETLLSGPAASVMGGMKLSGQQDCLVVDMGGTTSDLAVVRHSTAALTHEGVDMGGWRTGTKAIQIQTIGLGGDSLISFDNNEQITIGPRKAAPLSWMAHQWPQIKEELDRIHQEEKWHSLSLAEFYYLQGNPAAHRDLDAEEKDILRALAEGPRSLEGLAAAAGTRPYFMKTERLESLGLIGKGGLTPTDLMHISGDFSTWDAEAARMGAEILGRRLGFSVEQLVDTVWRAVQKRLYRMIVQHLLDRRGKKPAQPLSKDALEILDMGFDGYDDELQVTSLTSLPLVGIGAPIHVFLDKAAAALGTRSIVPVDAGVANAVGAITGSIIGEEVVTIKPHYEVSGISGYSCHSSRNYYETASYEEARSWAEQEAREGALEQAGAMGAADIELQVECLERSGSARDSKEGLLLETVYIGRGIGKTRRLAHRN